jgi:hypothetical protein
MLRVLLNSDSPPGQAAPGKKASRKKAAPAKAGQAKESSVEQDLHELFRAVGYDTRGNAHTAKLVKSIASAAGKAGGARE